MNTLTYNWIFGAVTCAPFNHTNYPPPPPLPSPTRPHTHTRRWCVCLGTRTPTESTDDNDAAADDDDVRKSLSNSRVYSKYCIELTVLRYFINVCAVYVCGWWRVVGGRPSGIDCRDATVARPFRASSLARMQYSQTAFGFSHLPGSADGSAGGAGTVHTFRAHTRAK